MKHVALFAATIVIASLFVWSHMPSWWPWMYIGCSTMLALRGLYNELSKELS